MPNPDNTADVQIPDDHNDTEQVPDVIAPPDVDDDDTDGVEIDDDADDGPVDPNATEADATDVEEA